jgi:hypothetical protein
MGPVRPTQRPRCCDAEFALAGASKELKNLSDDHQTRDLHLAKLRDHDDAYTCTNATGGVDRRHMCRRNSRMST